MRAIFLTLAISSLFSPCLGQKKLRIPAWSFHDRNTNIVGLSVGFDTQDSMNVNSYGVRIEIPGSGWLSPVIGSSPISDDEKDFQDLKSTDLSEKIYGINVSATGSLFCSCSVNGLNINGIGNIYHEVKGITVTGIVNYTFVHQGVQITGGGNANYKMNGLSLSLLGNHALRMNGVQITALTNHANHARGVQIGLYNKSNDLRGVQLGLWNVNQKRKLPFINWAFK